jgi:predicted ATPase
MLTKLTLEGFKSFRKLELELRPLNVMIGANGAGKSNFIAFFKFFNAILKMRLEAIVSEAGGADAFLQHGKKNRKWLRFSVTMGQNVFSGKLFPTQNDSLSFDPSESQISINGEIEMPLSDIAMVYPLEFDSIRVYHFVDTTATATIKGTGRINDNLELRSDGENLAAMLYLIRAQNLKAYQTIRDVIRSVAPYFDDFLNLPVRENPDTIKLEWREQGSDFPFLAKDLSDGTLRFMALVTLLLQPNPPAITVIDEPELGLHPFAIEELAGLLRVASSRTQLIVATQSPQLIAALEPEDVIVADRENGETTLRRLDANALEGWLEEYTLGELWQKNILGGVVNPNPVRSRSS